MEYEDIMPIEGAKPCPFCGIDTIYSYRYKHPAGVRYGAACGRCGCRMDSGTYQNRGTVETVWNTRKEN